MTSASSTPRRAFDGWWSGPLILLLVGGAFAAVAQVTLLIDNPLGQGAAFFPAAGISVGALLLLPERRWGWALAGIWTAEFIGNFSHGMPVTPCLFWAAANTVEPLIGATLLRRVVRTERYLVPIRNTLAFVACAVIAAPMVGAAIGAVGTFQVADYSHTFIWLKWWVGDALGVLVVAPVVLSWRERASRHSLAEQFVLCGLLLAASVVVYQDWPSEWQASVPYLMIPLLVWTALRHGVRWTTWAIAGSTQIALWATDHGYGPFVSNSVSSTPHALTSLQLYLGVVAVTVLLLSVLAEDLVDRRDVESILEYTAHHDTLTGLPNRAFLGRHLQQIDHSDDVALLLCDVDHFKVVNDVLGHHAGDALLVEIVERMQGQLPDDGVLVRLGGDEFVVVLGKDSAPAADVIAQRMVQAVSEPFRPDPSNEMRPSISVGVAMWEPEVDSSTAMRHADVALYEAKEQGRGRFHQFDHHLRERSVERTRVERSLGDALASGQVRPEFQPAYDLRTGELVCVEALARWHDPEHGVIGPDVFVPIAESTGHASALFDVVLARSIEAHQLWMRELGVAPGITVNLSTAQLSDRDLPGRLAAVLDAAGLDPSRLWLEVTEAGVSDTRSMRTLVEIHDLGVRLALSRFGTGWASTERLMGVQWHALKIDRSFVARLGRDPRAEHLLAAMVGIAHSVDVVAVAEGVETDEQLRRVGLVGCDMVQGYLLGRPQPVADTTEVIRSAVLSSEEPGRARSRAGSSPSATG